MPLVIERLVLLLGLGITAIWFIFRVIAPFIKRLLEPHLIVWNANRRNRIAKASLEAARLEAQTTRIQLEETDISSHALQDLLREQPTENSSERKSEIRVNANK